MLGAIIGGGLKLIGGLLGRSHQRKLQRQQMDEQRAYAQHGIQWRVADARRAGVHPLVALGASTHSYSPQQVGEDPMQRAMEGMGQDLSRAAAAGTGPKGRALALSEKAAELSLDNASLRNDMLRLQIRRMAQPATGPGVDVPAGHKAVPPEFMSAPIKMFGLPMQANPAWSNAQTIEDRYGDAASWVYGPLAAGADFSHSMRKFMRKHDMRRRIEKPTRRAWRQWKRRFGY